MLFFSGLDPCKEVDLNISAKRRPLLESNSPKVKKQKTQDIEKVNDDRQRYQYRGVLITLIIMFGLGVKKSLRA